MPTRLAAAQQPLGNEGGDAGSLNIVPNFYVTMPIDKQWSVGVGVNAPFGLVSEYKDGWIGRFQGLKSDIKTINVNPAVSWKATDNVAIGLGASYQHIDATFTSRVNYSAALLVGSRPATASRRARHLQCDRPVHRPAWKAAPKSPATTMPGAGTWASWSTSLPSTAWACSTVRRSTTP